MAEAAGLAAGTDVQVLFTPHLAPMNRGILATCYARPTGDDLDRRRCSTATATAYGDEPFVVVTDGSPSTKATFGSNAAHLTARYDERTGYVMAICAIDNLVKGASGQAVQCANILAGLDETAGLSARSACTRERRRHRHGAPRPAGRRHRAGRRPGRGAALHPALLRGHGRGQVRRQRHGRPRPGRPLRRGRRAAAGGRHPHRRRARRRSADRRADGPAGQDARVPRRPAGHRRRDARHRPHGAGRQGQPRHRVGHQRARSAGRRACRARTPA